MFEFPVTIKGRPADVVVRPNNDGACLWYVQVRPEGKQERDPPQDFINFFGDPNVAYWDDVSAFAKNLKHALKEAKRLVKHYKRRM